MFWEVRHSWEYQGDIATGKTEGIFQGATWEGPCGSYKVGYTSQNGQALNPLDPSSGLVQKEHCSAVLPLGVAAFASSLAPTPMLIPAVVFGLGGYIIETEVRNYYIGLYNVLQPINSNCKLFVCESVFALDRQLFNEEPWKYFFGQGLDDAPPVEHRTYPQSHVWWYLASAVCLLFSAHNRPLGGKNPFRRKF